MWFMEPVPLWLVHVQIDYSFSHLFNHFMVNVNHPELVTQLQDFQLIQLNLESN